MESFIRNAFLIVALFGLAFGHSQMRCAKYNKATGACSAPIRNQAVAFGQESYPFSNGAPICQSPMTNPISASYGNGAGCPSWAPCPDQMGSYTPGEQFTVMWWARNHAVENQNPATVSLYMSPKEAANQGADVSQATMTSNLICRGPYMNCGGVNVDSTPCTLDCTMPSTTAAGIYTLWWKWDWQGSIYTTCADINVSGGSSVPATPSTPTNPPTPASITSGRVVSTPLTTGRTVSSPATTGRTNVPQITSGSIASTRVTTGSAASIPVTTGSVSSSNSPCTLGHQKCSSSNTFQTCTWATSTVTDWAAPQSCQSGLSCKPHPVHANYIWCY